MENMPADIHDQVRSELKTISTATMWLQELKDKIQSVGLSQHDIRALASIRETVTEAGFDDMEPVPALEKYTPSSFTDERSSVNMDVGLESIGRTIVQTVKRWIKKLIEYIRKIVRWFRKEFYSEENIQRSLTKRKRAIEKTATGSSELATRYVKMDSREFKMQLVERWKKLLAESGFEYTDQQLAILGNPDRVKQMSELVGQTNGLTKLFEDMGVRMHAFLVETDSAPDTLNVDLTVFDGIQQKKLDTEKFKMVRPGKTIVKHHDATKSYFNNMSPTGAFRLPDELTKVTSYDYIYDVMDKVSDLMRKIEKDVDVVSDTDDVVKLLNRFSQSVDDLNHVAVFFYSHNQFKIKMLNLIADYENYRFSVMFKQAKENVVNEQQAKVLDKLRDSIEKFLRDVMQ